MQKVETFRSVHCANVPGAPVPQPVTMAVAICSCNSFWKEQGNLERAWNPPTPATRFFVVSFNLALLSLTLRRDLFFNLVASGTHGELIEENICGSLGL